ncbi:hypothetical protein HMPREF9999_00442 [Alloprevotella sp. oral taxon 473 str. F0040]|nr:hypothetical protein HMPREF9999_00442 [Alloprevotella sp. oral taxon 473 str. F0040]
MKVALSVRKVELNLIKSFPCYLFLLKSCLMGKWAVMVSSVEGKVLFSVTKLRVLWKIQKYME